MTLAQRPPIASSGCTVESVLAPIHDRWLNEIRRFLDPATSSTAGFWDRWTAIRYLADQFRDHFKLERALLVSVASLLPAADARRLTGQASEVERMLSGLDCVGRRRGTGQVVAEEAHRLIEEIAVWCAELELATSGLRCDALPAEASRVLEHVTSSGAVGSP